MLNAQTHCNHTHPAGKQGICDWAVLQRIQMKRFSHWIHSYSLFILLGETETLPLVSERPQYPLNSPEQRKRHSEEQNEPEQLIMM